MEHTKKVATVSRRTWDIEAYQKKADERRRRDEQEPTIEPPTTDKDTKPEFQPATKGAAGPEGSQRAFLQARTRKIDDLDERVGKKVEVTIDDAVGGTNDGGVVKKVGVGWQCTVCNCMLKDSHAYLDHINGRRHLKKLGFSMRVARATETDLQSKLSELKQQKLKKEEEEPKLEIVDYDMVVKEKDEAERMRVEERRKQRKERRKGQQQNNAEYTEDADDDEDEHAAEIDPELAAMMGFSSFGG